MNNNNNYEKYYYQEHITTETEKIELSRVKFQRHWVLWENYEPRSLGKQVDWSETIKNIFSFNDIISFWQFWNEYPGSNPANIFFNGERLR
jgi:hypothetical protein